MQQNDNTAISAVEARRRREAAAAAAASDSAAAATSGQVIQTMPADQTSLQAPPQPDRMDVDADDEGPTTFTLKYTPMVNFNPLTNCQFEDNFGHHGVADGHIITAKLTRRRFLSVLGVYDLTVTCGTISVNGARISKGQPTGVRMCVSASGPIPRIMCISGKARVQIRSVETDSMRVDTLASTYPAFRQILAINRSGRPEKDRYGRVRTCMVLKTVKDDPLGRPIVPLEIPYTWALSIEDLALLIDEEPNPVIVVAGGVVSGRTVYSRLLCNALLTHPGRRRSTTVPGQYDPVMLLDLDVAHQEYGLDHQISLTLVRQLNVSPEFCHTATGAPNDNWVVSSRAISKSVIRRDPTTFARFVQHMIQIYLNMRDTLDWSGRQRVIDDFAPMPAQVASPADSELRLRPDSLPLIVKMPASGRGVHDELLKVLLNVMKPFVTDFCEMPHLQESVITQFVDDQLDTDMIVHQMVGPPYNAMMRAPRELSTMKSIAYFHRMSDIYPDPTSQNRWLSGPSTGLAPLAIGYASRHRRRHFPVTSRLNDAGSQILGFHIVKGVPTRMVLDNLASLAYGAIVAISVISPDMTDIIGAVSHSSDAFLPFLTISTETTGHHHRAVERSAMFRSPPLGIGVSRTIGWGLVRGVDPIRRQLMLISPLSRRVLDEIPAERTVLEIGHIQSATWSQLSAVPGRGWVRATDMPGHGAFSGPEGHSARQRAFISHGRN